MCVINTLPNRSFVTFTIYESHENFPIAMLQNSSKNIQIYPNRTISIATSRRRSLSLFRMFLETNGFSSMVGISVFPSLKPLIWSENSSRFTAVFGSARMIGTNIGAKITPNLPNLRKCSIIISKGNNFSGSEPNLKNIILNWNQVQVQWVMIIIALPAKTCFVWLYDELYFRVSPKSQNLRNEFVISSTLIKGQNDMYWTITKIELYLLLNVRR